MRAIVCRELSGLDGLVFEPDWPVPEPGPGEVRIRVRAAGLNFADTLVIKGQYQDRPALPFVPGMEVAGQIERCGEGVAGFAPGDRVLATPDHGGFAEEVVTRAVNVVRLPDSIDDPTAAGFAIAYGTAYGALVWAGRLQAGEPLVVHGAAGGVGLATVECGKALGARVIATARGAAHLEVARARGADEAIDTGSEDVRLRIRELTGGRGADVVFDPVGGELFTASLRSIAWGGRILVIGFASGEIPQIPANLLLVKHAAAVGFYWGSYRRHDPARVHAAFEHLLEWHAAGKIRPHVSEIRPLAEARAALELLLARKSTGKVVLTTTDSH
jgi:NADPH2:quinone reductase